MEGLVAVLSQLGPACPALRHVTVTGSVGRPFLAALGASCSKLACLEVMDGRWGDELRQLHLILPALTHCKLAAEPHTVRWAPIPRSGACCLSLLSCTSLTSLDVGTSSLTLEMWQALPPGLRELRCALDTDPPDDLTVLRSLQHLECYCHPDGNYVGLCRLAAVVHSAPHLRSLHIAGRGGEADGSSLVSELLVEFAPSSISDMVYLNERIANGLVATSTLCAGGVFQGVTLHIVQRSYRYMEEEEDGTVDVVAYFRMLPTLPAFTGLVLTSDQATENFPAVAQGITSAFPNLRALALHLRACVNNKDLTRLGAFTALEHLSLEKADVNPSSLAMLCTRLGSLRMLRLKGCQDVGEDDGVALQSLLLEWGSKASVVVL